MSAYKSDNFSERLTAAASARKAALEKFRARPGPDDPAVLERQAARKAVAVAREARIAERKAAREVEAARQAAEAAARAAALRPRRFPGGPGKTGQRATSVPSVR